MDSCEPDKSSLLKCIFNFQNKGMAERESADAPFPATAREGDRGHQCRRPSRQLLGHEVHVATVFQVQASQDFTISSQPAGTLHEDDDVEYNACLNNSK